MNSVETRQRVALHFEYLSARRFAWLMEAFARAAILLATLLVALAMASPAFAAADVTYTFSGTLGPSDVDTNSLDVEGSVTGPATGSCPGGSGSGGAGCPSSWDITIDGQNFTKSNSSQINGSISQGYINFDLGSYPAPFGENGCNYLPLPNIPLDDPDQDDTDWGQDWRCIYGRTMFTVNFLAPNFDMNHDGGLYERDAETVTSFILVGGNTAPVITSNGGGATASVDAAENQTAVTTVEATDTEDDAVPTPLTFSITGGADAGKFDIGSASGVLTFKAAPDFEVPTDAGTNNIYDVQVTVTDSGSLTDVQAIAVTVTDVNEDTEPPSVQILGAPASLSDLTPFTVTIKFSEAVTGFVAGEVTVGNGTASDFTVVDPDTYTVLITPTGNGDVSIDVAAGVAEDGASNPNTAAAQIVVGNTIVADTQKLVSDFMSTRARLITQSQPDLIDRLTRDGGDLDAPLAYFASGHFSNYQLGFSTSLKQLRNPALAGIVQAAPADGAASGEASPFDIWIDARWAHADSGSTDADFGALHLGADYRINPDLLVGLMGQLDWTSQRDAIAGTAADGMGWMVGPYVVARLQEHLLFDASLLGGQSANQIDPLGLYVDSFSTSRWLAKAQLTGEFELGGFSFSPMLAASYFGETQHAYTDGLGNEIGAQSIGLGSLDFGPRLGYLFETEGADITPSLGLIGSLDHSVDGTGASSTELSARLESGLDISLDGGATLGAKAFYDGFGLTDRSAYGASGRLGVPLD